MRLYVDLNEDRHYVMTDDGESVYVEDLQEDGRDSELLEQAIEVARERRRGQKPLHSLGTMEIETFETTESDE